MLDSHEKATVDSLKQAFWLIRDRQVSGENWLKEMRELLKIWSRVSGEKYDSKQVTQWLKNRT